VSTPKPRPDSEPPERPRRRVSPWRVALGAAGSVGLLGVLISRADLDRVGAVFARVDLGWLALGFGLYVGLQAVRALRYRRLAPEASARVLLGVHFVHALLLRVMPLRTGELGFAWLMRRQGAGGFTQNLVGVLLLRILDLATVLAVFALALVTFGATLRSDARPSLPVAVTVGILAILAPLYIRHLVRAAHSVLDGILGATRLTGLARVRRAQGAVQEAVRWSSELPSGVLWQLTGLTTVQWAVNFVLFGVLLAAMGVDVTAAQTMLGGTGSVLGGLLPLAGVGNFGPLEAGWSVALAAVGVPMELAIASAFGFSVISFGYAALTALAGWLMLPRPEGSAADQPAGK